MPRRASPWVRVAGALGLASVALLWSQGPSAPPSHAEFHFLRVEYVDRFGGGPFGRGWWRQDWPEAEVHFAEGIQRLTRIHVGEGQHLPLTDDRLFDYPWLYATQVGFWDLKPAEVARLREYLLRGGFLAVDDFHGPNDWAAFEETMRLVWPDNPIVDVGETDPMAHVLYDITERTFIPGLRHLRRGPGGQTFLQPQAGPPQWRALHDAQGRVVVAVHFNMDVGDAWEHADLPAYPADMTLLAYRYGINSILYSMTH